MNSMQNPPMVTDEERRAYGDELLDLISRQSQRAWIPYAQRLANENQDLRNRIARSDARDTYVALEAEGLLEKQSTPMNASSSGSINPIR
jgi:hypothetical protein